MPQAIEFDKKDTTYIVRSYNDGWSLAVLANEFSVSIPTIRRVLADQNVTIRPRGRQPQN